MISEVVKLQMYKRDALIEAVRKKVWPSPTVM